MRLFKWLFQPVYILLIIVLVAVYVNRSALFSPQVAESLEAETLVANASEVMERLRASVESLQQTEEVSSDVEPSGDASAVADFTQAEVDEASDNRDEASAVAETTGLEEVLPEEATADTGFKQPVESVVSAGGGDKVPAVAENPAQEQKPLSSATPVINDDNQVQSVTSVTPEGAGPSAPPAEPLVVWRAARAAVWQGDLDSAVVHYRQLIALQPDNYDAHGELGNVLLAQSDISGATEAYVQAARLIRKAGNIEVARRVAGIVAMLDEARGKALYSEFLQP